MDLHNLDLHYNHITKYVDVQLIVLFPAEFMCTMGAPKSMVKAGDRAPESTGIWPSTFQ